MELKDVITEEIANSGKTVYRICKETGLDSAALYRVMDGTAKDIRISTIIKLAKGVGVEPWQIVKKIGGE